MENETKIVQVFTKQEVAVMLAKFVSSIRGEHFENPQLVIGTHDIMVVCDEVA